MTRTRRRPEVLRASARDWLHSPASLLHRLASHPPRARQRAWVAEADGQVVGFARARLRWEVSERSLGWLWIGVRPEHRGQSLGGALYDLAATHLLASGAERLETYTAEPAGRAFLEERGFQEQGGEPTLRLDLPDADVSELPVLEQAKAAEGFRLAPLAEVLDRPRELHALYAVASEDVPEESTVDDIRYEGGSPSASRIPTSRARGARSSFTARRPPPLRSIAPTARAGCERHDGNALRSSAAAGSRGWRSWPRSAGRRRTAWSGC